MERGLLWLPLLIVFSWLAWQGWNEYQKLEAYQNWAKDYDRSKFDIYAVLGQKDDQITWGVPTRKGPVDLLSLSLKDVQTVQLKVDQQVVDWDAPPEKGRAIVLELTRKDSAPPVQIPFTEIPLAAAWGKHLQQSLEP